MHQSNNNEFSTPTISQTVPSYIKVKSAKLDKIPTIKRPINAYLLWNKAARRPTTQAYKDKTPAEISKLLSEMWKNLKSETRELYVKEASRLKLQHQIDHPNHKFTRVGQSKKSSSNQSTQISPIQKSNVSFEYSNSPASIVSIDSSVRSSISSENSLDTHSYAASKSSSSADLYCTVYDPNSNQNHNLSSVSSYQRYAYQYPRINSWQSSFNLVSYAQLESNAYFQNSQFCPPAYPYYSSMVQYNDNINFNNQF